MNTPAFHVIKIERAVPAALVGQYLQGPRTRDKVKRDGYGFTPDRGEAWQFASAAKAHSKARIVAKHMGWHGETTVAILPLAGESQPEAGR